MARRSGAHHFIHVIALILISVMLCCSCQIVSTDSYMSSEQTASKMTLYPDSSDWSFEAEGAETMPLSSDKNVSDETDEDVNESSEGSDDTGNSDGTTETTAEPTFNSNVTSVGEGSYTFMIGNTKFHSSTDISLLIKPEDGSVYDFGARECSCTSVTFNPYKEIGEWKSPKGHDFTLYLVEILIISHNLEIRILPKETNSYDIYNVSINGRGYYASKDQLQMMDFVLTLLAKTPYVDPLEGLYTGTDHKYYF